MDILKVILSLINISCIIALMYFSVKALKSHDYVGFGICSAICSFNVYAIVSVYWN